MRVHVRPGAARDVVGGSHGDALVVRVRARAVDQAATASATALVASAFGVRASAVRLVRGATARAKVFELTGDTDALARRLAALLETTD